GNKLSDLRVQSSAYGETISKLYGSMRLSGNVIWANDITEKKPGGGDYQYSITMAIAICEGPVDEVSKIWADGKLVPASVLSQDTGDGKSSGKSPNKGNLNIHLGDEEQMPDSIIAKIKGHENFPAYRGLCYVVIRDFSLAPYGNRIPNFSFEVKRVVRCPPEVEDKIKEVILIPGSGEFVYGTKICYKQYLKKSGHSILVDRVEAMNTHNVQGKANVLVALDQMQQTLPNLQWVGLVVTWFATSSRVKGCRIVPKVEFEFSKKIRMVPNDWSVAGINRKCAEQVLYFSDNKPTYGGTPSDKTITDLCQELRARGMKIMLYPMVFVDEIEPSPKIWRGRIRPEGGVGGAAEVSKWFNKDDGYNRFIKHYATLTRGLVAAFIIGSEMIGMTSYKHNDGSFPAVDEFVKLAATVKSIVSSNCLVSYAADWSEYHHTKGGWYNLDPLWSSRNIDFVGIDAYFPLTEDLNPDEITDDLIYNGWESGEGWDYYCEGEERKHVNFNGYDYAWKNVEYWWSHQHTNPDGNLTAWRPKMKPIWFTEFGFPSVDGASNQPNVFYDPTSSESFFPRCSKGKVDFFAQRQALNASLNYLEDRCQKQGKSELVPRRFVWTWDARPFPTWPDYQQVWCDAPLWKTGHWINGKIGQSLLSSIVAELLDATGIAKNCYDTSRLRNIVSGYVISEHMSVREAIEQLQAAYFFDVVESDGVLKFMPILGKMTTAKISSEELIPANSDSALETIEINLHQELELPQKLSISHINQSRNYDNSITSAYRQTVNSKEQLNLSLPIILSSKEAQNMAELMLYNIWQERMSYQLTLPFRYAYLQPTDVIEIIDKAQGFTHQMHITKMDMYRASQVKISAKRYSSKIFGESIDEQQYLLTEDEDIFSYEYYLQQIECAPLFKSILGKLYSIVTDYLSSSNTEHNAQDILSNMPNLQINTHLEIINAPTLEAYGIMVDDKSHHNPIIYLAAISEKPVIGSEVVDSWSGAQIYYSMADSEVDSQDITNHNINLDESYQLLANIEKQATMGYALDKLPAAPSTIIDRNSSIRVQLLHGSLNSITDSAFFSGGNMAMLANELIQFQKAELINKKENIYQLSILARGLHGSEHAISQHQDNDRFVLLDESLVAVQLDQSFIDHLMSFKAVSSGSNLASSNKITAKCTAENLKPLSPVHLKANKVIKDNAKTPNDPDIFYTLTWIRRGRYNAGWRSNIEAPLGEETELYHLEIKRHGKIIAKFETSKPEKIFKLKQSISDDLTVTIYQVSAIVGRGYKAVIKP
ncbi:MAG: hypothetical protein DGJ47_000832, partial [Rickettsiaceae bacterium]